MITLSLLHPTELVDVQSWNFDNLPVIKIGRSKENDVIVYSAVVSRHHLELWNNPSGWEMINFGSNGTFIDNKPITQMPVIDGMIIRLGGNSGPRIRIKITKADVNAAAIKNIIAKANAVNSKDNLEEKPRLVRHRPNKEEVTKTDFD